MTPPPTRTARTLRRLRFWLLAATAGVLGGSLLAYQQIEAATADVSAQAAPAVVQAAAARAALIEADAAAVRSFQTGEARLAGPGLRYQNNIAVASRSLSRLAEDNQAGEAASDQIQLVEGLLVAYMNLIGQADAHFREADGGGALGLAYLWQASRLLHMEDSGILSNLDELRREQEDALAGRLSPGWREAVTTSSWAVPLLALLALLGVTQRFLSRRFRRTLNPPLIGATVLSVAIAAAGCFTLVAERHLESTQQVLSQVRNDWTAEMSAVDARGQQDLAELVDEHCPRGEGPCGRLIALLPDDDGSAAAGQSDDEALAMAIGEVDRRAAAAATAADVALLAPLAALVIAVLVLAGLEPRIGEYRFTPR